MITISLQFQTKYYCSSLINHRYVGSSAPRNHSRYLLGRVLARYSVLSFFLFFLPSSFLCSARNATRVYVYVVLRHCTAYAHYSMIQSMNDWLRAVTWLRWWPWWLISSSFPFTSPLVHSFFRPLFFTRETSVVYLGVIKIQMEIGIDIYCILCTVVQISR